MELPPQGSGGNPSASGGRERKTRAAHLAVEKLPAGSPLTWGLHAGKDHIGHPELQGLPKRKT